MNIGGKQVSNWWLIGGAAGAGLVVWMFRRNAAASSATSPAADQVDPVTGMTYAQETAQYGSVQAAEAAFTGSAYGLPGGAGGYGGTAGYPTSNAGTTTAPAGYATNAAWAQAATSGLAGLGYDPATVAAALGLFFAQHPLSASQAAIVQAAEAEYGPPPQGTYAIIPVPSSGGAVTTAPATAPGSFSITPHPGYVNVGWHAVTGASSYELLITGAGGKGTGTSHVDTATTGLNAEHVLLAPGAYHAQVRAANSAGHGPWTPVKAFTVTK